MQFQLHKYRSIILLFSDNISNFSRPVSVCWCPYLPEERIKVSTNVYILQHPFEVNMLISINAIFDYAEQTFDHSARYLFFDRSPFGLFK